MAPGFFFFGGGGYRINIYIYIHIYIYINMFLSSLVSHLVSREAAALCRPQGRAGASGLALAPESQASGGRAWGRLGALWSAETEVEPPQKCAPPPQEKKRGKTTAKKKARGREFVVRELRIGVPSGWSLTNA